MPVNLGKTANGRLNRIVKNKQKYVNTASGSDDGRSGGSGGSGVSMSGIGQLVDAKKKRTTSSIASFAPSRNSCDNIFAQDIILRTYRSQNSNDLDSGSLGSYRFKGKKADSASMYSQDSYRSFRSSRLKAGANRTQQAVDKLILSPSECKIKPPGGEYFARKTDVHMMNLELHGNWNDGTKKNLECLYSLHDITKPQPKTKTRTRGTQSLYRESSAQTLPYLPFVSNVPEELASIELFRLPTILPGDGPPGLYEVEVLERARKRWAFAKALKESFRKQLQEAREQAKLPQHQHILEAFEWEHWIEREEYIQECQMMRLDILIEMFNKREREMRTASQMRIQQTCLEIEKKRNAALKKSEIEYSRAMRRLEIQHSKRPRVWRKEHITHSLGDPTSEFYAPKLRFGVDPSRRHYVASRKGFDLRMDDLEKRAVNMAPAQLKCPFAKLNEWSKPKVVVQEVEQNFCSEVNLGKLYESLRTLRESREKPKSAPLCLKAKESLSVKSEELLKESASRTSSISDVDTSEYSHDYNPSDDSELKRQKEEQEYQEFLEEVYAEKQTEREKRKYLQREIAQEQFETLIHSFEGNTIGWLMRFLTEEMVRLKEQRKLQFFTMLVKRERKMREAAEAGLRQKENSMREMYENLYQEWEEANKRAATKYVNKILETEIVDYVEQLAQDDVVAVAKDIDKEVDGWLDAFRSVQNPQTYYGLRYALKDIVMPDVEKILYRLERNDCINYIINGVLLPNVFSLLEPYDISFALTSDFVDRLIDNDLYLDSPDCSDCECGDYCYCAKSRLEAMAIIRKLIRYAVPGQRWRTPTERVADENVFDIVDDVFDAVKPRSSILETNESGEGLKYTFSIIDFKIPKEELFPEDIFEELKSTPSLETGRFGQIGELPDDPVKDYTKELDVNESLLLGDPDLQKDDELLACCNITESTQQYQPEPVHAIPSTHDISSVWDFNKTPKYCDTSSEHGEEEVEEDQEKDYFSQYAEEWPFDESSSHRGIEEELIIPHIEEEEEIEPEVEMPIFEESKTVEIPSGSVEKVEKKESSEGSKLIAVSFSYDPSVKFTVPVPSTHMLFVDGERTEFEKPAGK